MFSRIKTWIKSGSLVVGASVGVISNAMAIDGFLKLVALSKVAIMGDAGLQTGAQKSYQEYDEVGFEALAPCLEELHELSGHELALDISEDFFAEKENNGLIFGQAAMNLSKEELYEELSELGLPFRIL